ncbi:MAG: hypothetical protein QW451_02525, partial [Candidatus Aenigmatarchaeota archaeon]
MTPPTIKIIVRYKAPIPAYRIRFTLVINAPVISAEAPTRTIAHQLLIVLIHSGVINCGGCG